MEKKKRVPLTHRDVRFLVQALGLTEERGGGSAQEEEEEERNSLLERFKKVCDAFDSELCMANKPKTKKKKKKKKQKAAQKKAIKPSAKYDWHRPVHVYQLEIRGTGDDEDQPATIHFAASKQALAGPMIDLLEDTDYLEDQEEELKEDLDNWLSSNGWLSSKVKSKAEYKQHYAERVTDRLAYPDDADQLCQACNDAFSNACFTILDIVLPRDGTIMRVEERYEEEAEEAEGTGAGSEGADYDPALDDPNTVLADIKVPNVDK